jgi:hypothetical protein
MKGLFMKQQRSKESMAKGDESSPAPEPDYRPKASSAREQVVFGLKLMAVIGIALLVLWLYEVYVV